MAVSLFFHNIGTNLAHILPQRPYPFFFFVVDFKWNMLGDSTNINNLCYNPVVLEKTNLEEPLKIAFLGPICIKKGLLWATPKLKNTLFGQK